MLSRRQILAASIGLIVAQWGSSNEALACRRRRRVRASYGTPIYTSPSTVSTFRARNRDRVTAACEANWEANQSDCNHFVKAVADALGVLGFTASMNADAILNYMLNTPTGWFPLHRGDDAAAKNEADNGKFVIGGLYQSDMPGESNGHLVVVVSGPLDPNHHRYPSAYWGRLNGVGEKNRTLNYAFPSPGRDNVRYFTRTL